MEEFLSKKVELILRELLPLYVCNTCSCVDVMETVEHTVLHMYAYHPWLCLAGINGSAFLFRYGHGSCLLSDGSIIVVGGYGESSRVGSAPHSRLSDTLKLHLNKNEWELCHLDTQGIYPGVNLRTYIISIFEYV